MLLGFVGDAGNAIVFVCLLVGEAIIGLCVLMYGAHCFLLVVEDTSAGNDAVFWPDEPLTDWFWKLFYLAWLAAIWLIPPWLLLRLSAPTFLTDHPAQAALLAGVAVWLLFPIGLLSSLGASSVWIVFRPGLLIRMARHSAAVAGYYGISAALLAGCSVLVYFALRGDELLWLVPVAGVAAAATLLIYARLLGRLAWLLHPPEPRERQPAKRPRQSDDADPEERPRRQRPPALDQTPLPAAVDQPAEVPAPLDGYGLKEEDPPALQRSVPVFEEEADEPDDPSGPSLASIEAARERRAIDAPPPPRVLFLSGIYTFPWYLTSLKAWIVLSLGALLITAGGRVLLHWWQ